MQEELWVLDFETDAIEDFAPLLPEPHCASLTDPNGVTTFYAWSLPEGNNCTWEEFRNVLISIWDKPILGQNSAGFDMEIATHWFKLPPRDPLLNHDTLFQVYLVDPHARSLSLKDIAAAWLGMPPDEQQELYDWIVKNVPGATRKTAGAYICKAPARLIEPYADGDVIRTKAVFDYCWPKIKDSMLEPYQRELRLAPILAGMRNIGVRVDLERLKADYTVALQKLHKLDEMIRERLKAPNLSVDSNDDLIQSMQAAGIDGFLTTPTGKLSAAKDSLDAALASDPDLRKMLKSRATYATLTSTFMGPWIEIATKNGGRIHAAYNQVRNPDGFGTRTGRLSSSGPNFQNVPTDLNYHGDEYIGDYWGESYPVMRSYLLPDEGHVWSCGDFKNQEPRLAAHFEDGALCAAFNENPELDPYLFVVELCGQGIIRKEAKVVFLGLLYAMGVASLADKLDCDAGRAGLIRQVVKAGIPDVVQLEADCKRRFRNGLPIRTLGGRLYYCEPPSNGRSWEYKALNTLIQGSAADQTKEALIYAHHKFKELDPSIRILTTVHDEYSVSHPEHLTEQVHQIMRESANAIPCDVPMLIDIQVGKTWAGAK